MIIRSVIRILDTKLQRQLRMSFHWSIIYTVPQTLCMTIEELTAKIRPCERKKMQFILIGKLDNIFIKLVA